MSLCATGVSSAHCIEKYELVELAQSFFLPGTTAVATPRTHTSGPLGVGQPPPIGEQQSDPGQLPARGRVQRAPLVFDALSEDEDDGGDWEADGAAFLHPRTVVPSAPTVLATAATFEQEDSARPSSIAAHSVAHSVAHAGDDTQEIPRPPVSAAAEPSVAERGVPTAPAGTLVGSSEVFTGDRPSSTYCVSNPAAISATIADGSDSEATVEEGNHFLVEGSVKTLKEFLRAHATDGDWQTLVEKAELREFALAVYERRQADIVRSVTTPQYSGTDSMEDDRAKGCGSCCMTALLRKLRNGGERSEIADE